MDAKLDQIGFGIQLVIPQKLVSLRARVCMCVYVCVRGACVHFAYVHVCTQCLSACCFVNISIAVIAVGAMCHVGIQALKHSALVFM